MNAIRTRTTHQRATAVLLALGFAGVVAAGVKLGVAS